MIQYAYTTKAILIFDDEFEVRMTDSLDEIVKRIEWASDEYGFIKADVTDANTGEILIRWKEGEEAPLMTQWDKNAHDVEDICGSFVDWDERFYQCPFCGEPIYDCDWTEEELKQDLCPICGAKDCETEDYESDDYDWD